MKNGIKCKICKGVILLSIVTVVHHPICKDCSEKTKKEPDIPVEQRQESMTRQVFVGGLSASVFTTTSDTFNNDPI